MGHVFKVVSQVEALLLSNANQLIYSSYQIIIDRLTIMCYVSNTNNIDANLGGILGDTLGNSFDLCSFTLGE